jgi:uncharacterized membrane protein
VDADLQTVKPKSTIAWLPLVAAIVALVGLSDAIYLTIHHYTAEAVPCGEMFDCEMVLTSPYATMFGLPQALFGSLAYFVAFSLALLTAFGNRRLWLLFGLVVTSMAAYSGWLIYVQAYYIHAFCQFCLLSAGTTFTLFLLFIISFFVGRPSR